VKEGEVGLSAAFRGLVSTTALLLALHGADAAVAAQAKQTAHQTPQPAQPAQANSPEGADQSHRPQQAKDQVSFGIDVARIGLWKEAMYRWEKAVELDPKNASARNNLAVAYEQTGEFDEANAEYEKALEIEPNNTYIRQNYELFREAYERKKRTDRRSGSN
jgi:Flp pilus assembly protein TadD